MGVGTPGLMFGPSAGAALPAAPTAVAPTLATQMGGMPMTAAAAGTVGAVGAASTAAAATAAANLSMGIGGAMTGGSLAGAAPIAGMAGLLGPAAVIAIPLIAMMMSDDDPTADARSAAMIENDLQRLVKLPEGEDKEAGLIDLEEKIYNNPNYLALMNKAAFNPDLKFGTKATSGGTGVIELAPNMKKVVAENQERFQKVVQEKQKAYEQVGGDQGAAPPPSPYRKSTVQIDEAAIAAGKMDDPRKKKRKESAGAIAGGGI